MKAQHSKFEGDFNVKLFIDKLARKPLIQQREQEGDSSFNPNSFINVFEKALKELDKQSAEVDAKIAEITEEKEVAHYKYQQNMEKLMKSFQETFAKFNRIDKQIYDRGNAAVRIGERMQSIERQREKADEAKILIERFSQLNQQQQLPAIMTDDSRLPERAILIKKLLSITQELESIPNKTELGKKRVEECSNDLENRLLQLFDQAQSENNFERMNECARTLWSFNGGSSVVKRYISQQPIFLNSALWATEGETLGKEKIKYLFSKLQETCSREQEITQKVFPNHGMVMKQLLEKIFLQYIQRLLELSLPDPESNDGLREWLCALDLVFDLTNELINKVSSYHIPDMDYESIRSTLFSDYIDEYNDREICWLASLYHEKLLNYNILVDNSKDVEGRKPKKTFTRAEEEEHSLEMMQLSGEMAIEFIHANKEAIERCIKIVKPENLAQSVHSILTNLIKFMGYDYLDAVLAHALRVFIPDNVEDKSNKASKYMALIDKKLEGITTIANSFVSDEISRKISQFFGIVRQATHSVVLFLEYFQASIFPHISTEENQKMQCIMEKNALVSSLEAKIHPGLEKAIQLVTGNVDQILLEEQKKIDFKLTDDQLMDSTEFTFACKKVLKYLNEHYNTVKSTLDGGNARNYLARFGISLYSVLLEHVKRQQISLGLGGMMLLRDLTQYKDFVRKFDSKIVSEKFAILRDVANIHIVPSENIQTLIEDSHLANMDRVELMSIIQLRSDMNQANNTNTPTTNWRSKIGIK